MKELIGQLVKQLGVQENQAQGGVGLLLKFAREQLGAGDFGKVAEKLPGAEDLVKAAPEAGGAGGLLGGLASAIGGKAGGLAGLASVAAGFSTLGLKQDMIAKFVPVVMSFAQSKGGPVVAALLQKALQPQQKA